MTKWKNIGREILQRNFRLSNTNTTKNQDYLKCSGTVSISCFSINIRRDLLEIWYDPAEG
jgi:hypothetical protein